MTTHQLRITLRGSRPPIWRRALVKSDISLRRLHRILQIVMGWTDSHLYEFEVHGNDYGDPHPDYGGTMLSARTMKLNRAVPAAGERFVYRYDFGDGWEHDVVVEKVLVEQAHRHAVCLGGKRSCPPEDCGGIGGYAEFLAALGDPRHPEHESMRDWIGGEFDPEEFDIEGVNAVLTGLR